LTATEQRGLGDGAPALTAAAYGLRFDGFEAGEWLAVLGAAAWPLVHVRTEVGGDLGPRTVELGERFARLRTAVAELRLDRDRHSMTVRTERRLPTADLVHPALWPAAAVFARWNGAETLHAGAFLDDHGEAWAMLGAREAGKSSLLAAIALHGRQVLVDDLLVLAAGQCFAGPRCVDLRAETASALGLDGRTAPVRSTQRRRLPLAPCDAVWPLRGFVHLEWGNELAIETLAPAEHFGLLTAHRRVSGLGADPEQLLELAGLPALRLRRPPAWPALQESCLALLAAL
jgi:hypothetical protein